jgi:putative PIN family toxin of toxin-antitoxin system
VRAVFDTNVLIAAFLTEGICSKLLLRARRKQFHLITCPFILQELERVLKKKFSAANDDIHDARELIIEAAQRVVHPEQTVTGVCADADDDNILACALTAGADYLVTGDADLLKLIKFRGTLIITPREFEMLFDD